MYTCLPCLPNLPLPSICCISVKLLDSQCRFKFAFVYLIARLLLFFRVTKIGNNVNAFLIEAFCYCHLTISNCLVCMNSSPIFLQVFIGGQWTMPNTITFQDFCFHETILFKRNTKAFWRESLAKKAVKFFRSIRVSNKCFTKSRPVTLTSFTFTV